MYNRDGQYMSQKAEWREKESQGEEPVTLLRILYLNSWSYGVVSSVGGLFG